MIEKLMGALIWVAFGLAFHGDLSRSIERVAKLAADAQRQDLVSLSEWNRTLNGASAMRWR